MAWLPLNSGIDKEQVIENPTEGPMLIPFRGFIVEGMGFATPPETRIWM